MKQALLVLDVQVNMLDPTFHVVDGETSVTSTTPFKWPYR